MKKFSFALAVAATICSQQNHAATIAFRGGETSPPAFSISPAFPTEADVITFMASTDGMTYGNACEAAIAHGGAPRLTLDFSNRVILAFFDGNIPAACPDVYDPVNGVAGDFGKLPAGQWSFRWTNSSSTRSFRVYPDPRKLRIQRGPRSTVKVSWTASAARWQLESNTNLNSNGWQLVTNVVIVDDIDNNEKAATFSAASAAKFFRLRNVDCANTDLPDPEFRDENCDGIDGTRDQAVFVSPAGGDSNAGTMDAPVATLERAIQLASSSSPVKHVYAARGDYALSQTLHLSSGVSLFGQYDGPPAWNRSAENTTTINGASTAVLARNIMSETHLEGFTIRAAQPTAASASSYGIVAYWCFSNLVIRFNNIIANAGAPGTNGVAGTPGANGDPGGRGGNGACNDDRASGAGGPAGTSVCSRTGGMGGRGGSDTNEFGFRGQNGGPGVGGTLGGPGGAGGQQGSRGGDGQPGAGGPNGNHGSGGSSFGTFDVANYFASAGANGTAAGHGNGGGGGGGGGGQTGTFAIDGSGNGGGGGGAGGCGGNYGNGGGGGGGSFGLFILTDNVIIDQNRITTSAGGRGGDGGNGGAGGMGGSGGPGGTECTGEVGGGGNGGPGGRGGHAGAGGGGGGGPSIGIFIAPGAPNAVLGTNQYIIGPGGEGGLGGTSPFGAAPSGSRGLSMNASRF